MSLNSKSKLAKIALTLARDLRRHSTPAESMLWDILRNNNFLHNKFYRQYPLYHDITGKETFFIADFYCPKAKLIIEIDGDYHKYQLSKDQLRTEILNTLGLQVVRFSNEEILDCKNEIIQKLMSYLE